VGLKLKTMVTEEKYQEIKTRHVDHVKNYMTDMGGIFPHLTVYGKSKRQEEDAIIHIPIPDELMKSEELKDKFVDTILPKIAEKIRIDFDPYGVAWTSEAWVRTAGKEEGVPDNWKTIPIDGEILMVNMDFENKSEMLVYDIKRNGKQVTEDGDIVDHVELIEKDMKEASGWGGRFTGLLKKFKAGS
jgi:hypothetical protein